MKIAISGYSMAVGLMHFPYAFLYLLSTCGAFFPINQEKLNDIK